MTDQWRAAATVVAIGPQRAAPRKGTVMHRKALVLALFVALTGALAITSVATATSRRPKASPGSSATNTIAQGYGNRQANAHRARSETVAQAHPATQLSPAERITLQEDARRNDPRIHGTSPADSATRSVVEIVAPSGFDWADAGVGAGAAFALLLLGLGVTVLVRNRPLTGA